MSRSATRLLPLIALLASLALAACGGDDESTTTTVKEEPAAAPEGPLTAQGVGDVNRGASTAEVEEAFGPADSEDTAPGCELAGPNAPEVLTWTYDLGDSELLLHFDPGSGELVDYRTDSPSLETALGDRVGDDFSAVQDNWGNDLKPFPLGQPTPQEGIWAVQEGPEDTLMFDVRGGAVSAILGGFVQICE